MLNKSALQRQHASWPFLWLSGHVPLPTAACFYPALQRRTYTQQLYFTLHEQTICSAQTGRYSQEDLQARTVGQSWISLWLVPSPEELLQCHHQILACNFCVDRFQIPARQDFHEKKINDTWHPLSFVNKQDQTKSRWNFKSYSKCRTGTCQL